MLTKWERKAILYVGCAIVIMTLLAFSPIWTGETVSATETEETVDITQEDVNENDLNQDEDIEDEDENTGDEDENLGDEDENSSEEIDSDEENNSDSEDFAADFPESYREAIKKLHEEHPSWIFEPAETGLDWKTVIKIEDEGTTSLISKSAPENQREEGSGEYDGGLYKANKAAIKYYMDPRNFLNEKDIFQFVSHEYDEDSQNVETINAIIGGSFMDGKKPGGEYETFAACIDDAGLISEVNSNVLAAMIIQEQGWDGTSLTSGEKEGYEGFYNFYNIGAWTTDDMSNSERGLWYAKGEDEGKTTYGRPWNKPYKSICGGAENYYKNYVSDNQNTYYTKKYNVMNGEENVGKHQYMTNVDGAYGEGRLVRKAYEGTDSPVKFIIPVYEDMPKNVCELP